MRASRPEQKRLIGAVLLIVTLSMVLIGFLVANYIEQHRYSEQRESMSSDFGQLPTIVYQNRKYRAKPSLSSILLIGYDLYGDEVKPAGYRGGGQADFMMLLVIDHHNKQIRQLLLDRDTMTDVAVIGLTGRATGTRNMQLCLAHAYGKDIHENDAHTREAVENLLQGIKIDGTVSMRLGFADLVNRILGGVTVTLDDDFSAQDPTMTRGATLKLTDEQAALFVHARMGIGDGMNSSRMRRHTAFMAAAGEMLMQNIQKDHAFAKDMMRMAEDFIDSSLAEGRLINEMNRAYSYQVLPMDTLAGEHAVSDRGFMEFHADEDAIMSWVIDAFYSPVE